MVSNLARNAIDQLKETIKLKLLLYVGFPLLGAVLVLLLFIFLVIGLNQGIPSITETAKSKQEASQLGIDPELMKIYQEIAEKYGIPWEILAAAHQASGVAVSSTGGGTTNVNVSGQYGTEIAAASSKYGVDPNLIKAIIQQESGWKPTVVSSAGAVGLMQVMPFNCQSSGLDPRTTCREPAKNIMTGTKIISSYLKRVNGDLKLGLASYNGGPNRVSGLQKKYGQSYESIASYLPKETQNYVVKVTGYYAKYGGTTPIQGVDQRKSIEELAQKISDSKKTPAAGCLDQAKSQTKLNPDLACGLYGVKNDWAYVKQVESSSQTFKAISSPAPGEINSNMKYSGGRFPWPVNGRLTSKFGPRWGRNHNGLDIAAPIGTPIYAPADGVINISKANPGGFGWYVKIDHGGGFETLYGHMYPNTVTVKVGDRVKKGQKIAEVGNNGHSTGPHLHWEVHVHGKPVNPEPYLMK
ncbi:peptidoglycan DD-metalloendopeptidase family protein [Thermoactinomyces sp. DSM 45892]|uniref:peptidoglycan DD-metalloendopeptidase family protein n=1 Tax=Thermoactinomyces sp. DSM 45892 TaxID=1882753 RepID=UPI00089772D3|nr:peptidoglycan DD-metalloendopeptidase family protein [Thermoactinomyces sp. DSM 45892]SDY87348.1 Transglycosylase SLT domain-containing protein [Thermoactinomyces sp. DSM 45892]